ncbi:Protein of unknown function [Lentzea xinjiangensis]|uniref:DUF4232 domain-containing protein n=1 Tax=Lentzea xinjiangensis TaxID=402600 RepID=A0A1H9M4T9_9PSEU|nr:DUF4232 domain-containing protein [Lentzea xinjiangensis]SER18666.1 Protein of unknown function [Lentzea xinjiangensis]
MRVRILVVALVAGISACGAPTAETAPRGQVPVTSASAEQGPALKAELTMQGKPGLGLLAATNQGSAPITFQGWPKLSFTDAAGERAAIPVEQKLVPGEGPSITLQPGQTAFAGVQLDVDDDTKSVAINEMTAELPGVPPAKVAFIGTDGRPISDLGTMKVSEAEVSTMQPSSQGVLAFG